MIDERIVNRVFDTLSARGELSREALAEWLDDLTGAQLTEALHLLLARGRVIAKRPCPDSMGRVVTYTAICRRMMDDHLARPADRMVRELAEHFELRTDEGGPR